MCAKLRDAFLRRWRQLKLRVGLGKPLWLWLFVAGVIALVCYLFPVEAEPASRVRWTGILLQLAGVGTVWVGLDESRRLFGRPSMVRGAMQYLRSWWLVLFPPKTDYLHAEGLSPGAPEVGRPSVTLHDKAGQTLEDRMAVLESEMKRLNGDLSKLRRDVRQEHRELAGQLERESAENRARDEELEKKLETAIIGGIQLEAAGVWFLIVGIVLAHAPEEVVWLFGM